MWKNTHRSFQQYFDPHFLWLEIFKGKCQSVFQDRQVMHFNLSITAQSVQVHPDQISVGAAAYRSRTRLMSPHYWPGIHQESILLARRVSLCHGASKASKTRNDDLRLFLTSFKLARSPVHNPAKMSLPSAWLHTALTFRNKMSRENRQREIKMSSIKGLLLILRAFV